MRFLINETEYQLGFNYPDKVEGSNPKTTVAFLKDAGNNVICEAKAILGKDDSFVYEKGRSIALDRLKNNLVSNGQPILAGCVALRYKHKSTSGRLNIINNEGKMIVRN